MVIDASAVLAFLLQSPAAKEVGQRLREARGNLHAPHLLDVEVMQVLRQIAASDPEQAERCCTALEDLRWMPIFRHSHDDLLEEAWESRDRMSTNESFYVALARHRSETLLTCYDGRVISGTPNVALDR